MSDLLEHGAKAAMVFAFQSVIAVTSVAALLEPLISCDARRRRYSRWSS